MKNSVTKGMEEMTIRKGTVRRVSWSTTDRLGIGMLDTSSKGIRCRAARDIPSLEGMIKSFAMGTIVFELVGGNCHFVNVYWDHGVDSLVSPQEIVVNDSALVWH